jgi:hypothetical protein
MATGSPNTINLADSLRSYTTANTAASDAANVMRDQSTGAAKVMAIESDAQAQTYNAKADAQAVIERTAETAKLQQQQIQASVALRMGADPSATGYKVTDYTDRIAKADSRQQEVLATIQEKNSRSLLDNPLAYLHGLLTIDSDIAEYKGLTSQIEMATNERQNLLTATKSAQEVALSTVITTNQNTIDAKAIQAGADSRVAANQAKINGARSGLEAQGIAFNMSLQQAELSGKTYGAVMQNEQHKVALANLQISREHLILSQNADDRAGEAEKRAAALWKEKTDSEAFMFDALNAGSMSLNKTPYLGDTKKAMELYKKNQPEMVRMINAGIESMAADPSGNNLVYSNSPAQASKLYMEGAIKDVPPAQKPLLDRLVDLQRKFDNPSVQAGYNFDPKDPHARDRAFNQYISQQLGAELAEVKPGSIFAPTDLKILAANNPFVAQSPVWTKVLKPLADTGVDLNDPQVVINAIKASNLSFPDQLDIAAIYKIGLKHASGVNGMFQTGLPPVTTYNTTLRSGSGYVGNSQVDLASKESLTRFFVKSNIVTTDPLGDALRTGVKSFDNIPGQLAAEYGRNHSKGNK